MTRSTLTHEPRWHALSHERPADVLGVDPHVGLSDDEAARRLHRAGPNELAEPKSMPLVLLFVRQYRSAGSA